MAPPSPSAISVRLGCSATGAPPLLQPTRAYATAVHHVERVVGADDDQHHRFSHCIPRRRRRSPQCDVFPSLLPSDDGGAADSPHLPTPPAATLPSSSLSSASSPTPPTGTTYWDENNQLVQIIGASNCTPTGFSSTTPPQGVAVTGRSTAHGQRPPLRVTTPFNVHLGGAGGRQPQSDRLHPRGGVDQAVLDGQRLHLPSPHGTTPTRLTLAASTAMCTPSPSTTAAPALIPAHVPPGRSRSTSPPPGGRCRRAALPGRRAGACDDRHHRQLHRRCRVTSTTSPTTSTSSPSTQGRTPPSTTYRGTAVSQHPNRRECGRSFPNACPPCPSSYSASIILWNQAPHLQRLPPLLFPCDLGLHRVLPLLTPVHPQSTVTQRESTPSSSTTSPQAPPPTPPTPTSTSAPSATLTTPTMPRTPPPPTLPAPLPAPPSTATGAQLRV